MTKIAAFFHNFFLATGVIWFFAALALLIFHLNYEEREILFSIILPLAWAVIKQFDQKSA